MEERISGYLFLCFLILLYILISAEGLYFESVYPLISVGSTNQKAIHNMILFCFYFIVVFYFCPYNYLGRGGNNSLCRVALTGDQRIR